MDEFNTHISFGRSGVGFLKCTPTCQYILSIQDIRDSLNDGTYWNTVTIFQTAMRGVMNKPQNYLAYRAI